MGQSETSLYTIVEKTFSEHGIGDLFRDAQRLPYERLQQKVEHRLRSLATLPTLPEIVLKVMQVTADPRGTAAQPEELLAHDPAIVHKLLQVANSPLFTGPDHQGEWSLQEESACRIDGYFKGGLSCSGRLAIGPWLAPWYEGTHRRGPLPGDAPAPVPIRLLGDGG